LDLIDLATSPTEKPKIDIYTYFGGIDGLGKDHRPQSQPTTIGAARKASLSKDVDPIVLRVKIHLKILIIIFNPNRFENGLKVKKEIFEHYYVHYQL
jgi:hypothetical protein